MKSQAPNPRGSEIHTTPVFDTRALVKRHMEDPNHRISEEELQQIIISTDHIDISQHPLIKALDNRD